MDFQITVANAAAVRPSLHEDESDPVEASGNAMSLRCYLRQVLLERTDAQACGLLGSVSSASVGLGLSWKKRAFFWSGNE